MGDGRLPGSACVPLSEAPGLANVQRMDLFHTLQHPAGPGPHPTIIALHGWGANAHDLFGLAPHLLGGEALVVCPQGPIEVPQGPPGGH